MTPQNYPQMTQFRPNKNSYLKPMYRTVYCFCMKVLVSPKRGRVEAGSKQHFRRSVDKDHLDCCLFFSVYLVLPN